MKKFEEKNKIVKILFGCRAVLWLISAGITAYWIRLSFQLYEIGIHDEHEYAMAFRPVFYKCIVVTVLLILISFRLRKISDGIKKSMKKAEETEKNQ